ncbi:MAG: hypothetical protein CMO55_25635 [Verrucomicrobiales bacterium]|nr:hypothetical protein [Verrucomicrobiales bacterium]
MTNEEADQAKKWFFDGLGLLLFLVLASEGIFSIVGVEVSSIWKGVGIAGCLGAPAIFLCLRQIPKASKKKRLSKWWTAAGIAFSWFVVVMGIFLLVRSISS